MRRCDACPPWSRRIRSRRIPPSHRDGAGGDSDEKNGEWRPNASVDLSYQRRRAFDVPRLNFVSTLRFVSDSYFPVVDEPDIDNGRNDRIWDNRFDYTVGRLQLRLTARVSEIRTEDQTLLLFQARRMFGDS